MTVQRGIGTMQFLLQQQAQSAADSSRVDAQLETLSGSVDQVASGLIGLTSIVGGLASIVGRVVDSVSEVAVAQKRTEEHLDIVVDMFERHLREDHGHRPS
jgi:hypothetical protein